MERVAPDTYCVDTHLMGTPGACSLYVLDAAEPTVVDAGEADTPDRVLAALDELGIAPDDVRHLLVSHVHLDHAGGAGRLARECPNATVHVHERGLPYLTDAAKLDALKASVDRAMGTENAYGEPELVPADRANALADGDRIDLGDRVLDCVDAPGHAPHHVAAFDTETEALFSIDSAGMHFEGRLYPTTPPPAFDLAANVETCERLAELEPSVNLYGHFGAGGDDAVAELDAYPGLLREWVDVVERKREAHGASVGPIVADLDARWQSPTVQRDVAGVLRWLD
ncbi:MBL fold metallo-hydrolase [Halorarius halobius]|uniref:MBL fold metallo-hydrolase n=1 Tax=Halorarius halobius TaxID=2962671 RepID=UPI0020CDE814|nr:MBL fold metallo-hydrolase [Halorarius halobius]